MVEVDESPEEKMVDFAHAKVMNDGSTVDEEVIIKGDMERQVVRCLRQEGMEGDYPILLECASEKLEGALKKIGEEEK